MMIIDVPKALPLVSVGQTRRERERERDRERIPAIAGNLGCHCAKFSLLRAGKSVGPLHACRCKVFYQARFQDFAVWLFRQC